VKGEGFSPSGAEYAFFPKPFPVDKSNSTPYKVKKFKKLLMEEIT
jgi:hypothetical protein